MMDLKNSTAIFTEPKRLYDQTLALLEEARDFLIDMRFRSLSDDASQHFMIEGTRLTARLTEMMAWLMGRRAVAAGEISFETGREMFRLEFQPVCSVDHASELAPELAVLRDLLDRSLALYRRIMALDAGFDYKPGVGDGRLRVVA